MKILKFIFLPLLNWFRHPKRRYRFLPLLSQFFSYDRREEVLKNCLGYVDFNQLKGDYLEFGVWKGGSLIATYHMAKKYEHLKNMKCYAFDSFEGLPEKKGVDAEYKQFAAGEYNSSLPEVKMNLKRNGVDPNDITFVKGWYDQALNGETRASLPIKKAVLVYIDCDLYESTVPVLDFITPYIQDGTVIIFDDWFCFNARPDKGEQKAFAEWLEKNPSFSAVDYKDFGWSGKSFIINFSARG
jgi:O-methyltransferase